MMAGEEPRGPSPARAGAQRLRDLRMTGVLGFPSGFTATFASHFTASTRGSSVVGSTGIVRVPDPWHCRQGVVIVDGEERRVDVLSSYASRPGERDGAIRAGGEALIGRDETMGQARTIEAVYRSVDTGEPVSVGG